MPITTVMFSACSRHRRRDAELFLALHAIQQQANALRHRFLAQYGTQEDADAAAIQLLRQLKPIDLEPIRVLGQGQAQQKGHQNFDRIIAHYPILALALIEPSLATAMQ